MVLYVIIGCGIVTTSFFSFDHLLHLLIPKEKVSALMVATMTSLLSFQWQTASVSCLVVNSSNAPLPFFFTSVRGTSFTLSLRMVLDRCIFASLNERVGAIL